MKRTYEFTCKAQGKNYGVKKLDDPKALYPYFVTVNGTVNDGMRFQYLQDAITHALELCLPQFDCEIWGPENKCTIKGQKQ